MDSFVYRTDVPGQDQLQLDLHHHHQSRQQPQQQHHQQQPLQDPVALQNQDLAPQLHQQQPLSQQSQLPLHHPVRPQHPLNHHHPPVIPPRSTSSYTAQRGLNGEVERKASHDSKPRLSKEQHDILESHFKIQPKPSTQTKKSFADTLGVPLDKINNWFQNRRAKVKQEHKKRQQAYQLYLTPAAAAAAGLDPSPIDSAWIDPSFYHTVEPVPRHSMMIPPSLPVVAEVGDPIMAGPPTSFDHDAMVGMTVMTAGPEPTCNDPLFHQFFGFPDAMPINPSVELNNSLSAYSKQFNSHGDSFEPLLPPNVDFEGGYHSSGGSSMLTRSSNDDSSLQLSNLSGDDMTYHWESFTSAATVSSRPSIADSRSDVEQSHYTHLRANGSTNNLPRRPSIQQHVPEQAPNFDAIHPATTMARQLRTSQSEQCFNTRPEHFFSRAQADLREAQLASEAIDEAGEDERPNTAIKQPANSMDLASRRRQRPAALNTMRTSSFNSLSTAPPQAASAAVGSDNHLRRIKSSTGVLTGRIQKSASGPLPRSPAHLSFSDAASSSNFSMTARAGSITSLQQQNNAHQDDKPEAGPLTPASPDSSHQHMLSMTDSAMVSPLEAEEEMMWSQMTDIEGGSAPSNNTDSSTTDEPDMKSYESPPSTPRVGPQQMPCNDLDMANTEPESGPVWRHPFDSDIQDMPAMLAQDLSHAHDFHSSLTPEDEMYSVPSHRSSIAQPRVLVAANPPSEHPMPFYDPNSGRLRHSTSQQQFVWPFMGEGIGADFNTISPGQVGGAESSQWARGDNSELSAPPRRASAIPTRNFEFSNHTPATFSSP